jgi:hypothetical protein
MRFTDILESNVAGNELKVWLLGEDKKRYEFVLPVYLAIALTLVLQQTAKRLPKSAGFQFAALYTPKACQPIAAEGQKDGVVLTTEEGFEIPLILGAPQRAILRDCMDQIERGIPPEGAVH